MVEDGNEYYSWKQFKAGCTPGTHLSTEGSGSKKISAEQYNEFKKEVMGLEWDVKPLTKKDQKKLENGEIPEEVNKKLVVARAACD